MTRDTSTISLKGMKMRIHSISLPFILLLLPLTGCSEGSTSVDPAEPGPPSATITIQNVGSAAYRIVGIEGTGAQGEVGIENPRIELRIGQRYAFENQGGASAHPLDFRDTNRQKLFGQSRQASPLDDDPGVAVAYQGNRVTFTLTPELASALGDYVCSFHPSMGGALVPVGG